MFGPVPKKLVQADDSIPPPLQPTNLLREPFQRHHVTACGFVRAGESVVHQDRGTSRQLRPRLYIRPRAVDPTPEAVAVKKLIGRVWPGRPPNKPVQTLERARRNTDSQEHAKRSRQRRALLAEGAEQDRQHGRVSTVQLDAGGARTLGICQKRLAFLGLILNAASVCQVDK